MAETYYKMIDNRVHDVEPMNDIIFKTDTDKGGAPYSWHIFNKRTGKHLCEINFQNGPRKAEGSVQGVKDEDLLEIVRVRLQSYLEKAKGEINDTDFYGTKEEQTYLAYVFLTHTLMSLEKRAKDRKERGVLGTMER